MEWSLLLGRMFPSAGIFDIMSAIESWGFRIMSAQISGEFSRGLARTFLGETRGRSVSRIVQDETGLPMDIFHILLVGLAAWGVSSAVSRQGGDAVDTVWR